MTDDSTTSRHEEERKPAKFSWSWIRLALDLRSKINLQGKHGIYLWAILVGFAGACTALVFEHAVILVQNVFSGDYSKNQLELFSTLSIDHRILIPMAGGLVAGLILLFTYKFIPGRATEYMEAVALGDGYVPAKSSLLRTLSAVFTIGSGAAIGREGPLVQSSAVVASYIGRYFRLPVPRLRLVVACGAAAGMSAAFHTPLAGGLFVGEIVLGVLTIDLLSPLLVASCSSYLVISLLGDTSPLYQVSGVSLGGGIDVVFYCILLGSLASVCAKGWLWFLKKSRKILNGKKSWLPVRLALAGALVGVMAIKYPEIVGNGAHIIRGLVGMQFSAEHVLILLGLKVLAVAVFFGVGAVGGVLTPSLTLGGILGFLFSCGLTYLGVPGEHAIAFSLVGMAAFFTTAANAPMTSLLLVIEFTMAGQMMFPLIVGVLISYGMARLLKADSMYSNSLSMGPRSIFNKQLDAVQLKDISRKTPPVLRPNAKFETIASMLLKNPSQTIFVTSGRGRYLGMIVPEDVAVFAKSREIAKAVLALDVMRSDVPALPSTMNLPDALEIFSQKMAPESLPLIEPSTKSLDGVVNKTDLYLVLSEIMRREKLQ